MNTILIAVTALALAMAAGMAVVVVTMLRHERARSDARIEALSALAAEPGDSARPTRASAHFAAEQIAQWREAGRRSPESTWSLEDTSQPTRIVADPLAISDASAPRLNDVDDFEIRPSVAGVAELFVEPDRPSPWTNRLVAIGCFAAIVLAIGIALTTFGGTGNAPGSQTTSTTSAKPKADVAPLELLALRHTQESDRIVVTGLVQNPRTAAPIAHVAATVFVFGPDGTFLSSNQAPLDYTTLTPGGESQFVVSVPVTGQVSRYRVGFRTEDGQVLPHVDKRAPDALAQK